MLLFTVVPLRASDPDRQLTPYFRHWLNEEVTYIISTDERRSFLALHSDVERENYIQAFWEARNPNPGAGDNSYKEEHYRRLAYASEHFGSARYQDGWQTERGRVYITLGPPKATQTYHLTANIRDLEIWFYQSPSPALPTFFNILFFRPGAGEDYKIYSPRSDGPYRLVTTGQQNNQAAMHVIQQQLGPELAHAALSLIPTEPVDLDSGEPPSMTSDLMLGTLRDLPDNPAEKERVVQARLRERATSSILVPSGGRELQFIVVFDDHHRRTLSYLLRSHTPEPALIGTRKDGKPGYSLALRTSLFTSNGRLIFQQSNAIEGVLTPQQVTAARTRDFAAEDRLPILPGEYQLEVSVRNNLTGLASVVHDRIVVPEIPSNELALSSLMTYNGTALPDGSSALPFSFAGLRFPPRGVAAAQIHVGDRLPVLFQLHLPAVTDSTPRPAAVHLQYRFGSVAGNGLAPTVVEEDLSTASADADGNLVTGRTLDTFDLPAGTYRVVVRASGAAPLVPASSALQLHVLPSNVPIAVWTAYGPVPPSTSSQDDLKRGLIAAAEANPELAISWYRASLHDHPDQPEALTLLSKALSGAGRTGELAALRNLPQFQHAADPDTVISVAAALQSTGAGRQALELLKQQTDLQPRNAALLNATAKAYEQAGDLTRARDLHDRAAQVYTP